MPRGLSNTFKTYLAGGIIDPVYFVSLDITSPIYVWNGKGTVSLPDANGITRNWTGVGDCGVISGIEHDRTLRSTEVTLGLIGIPGNLVSSSVLASTRSIRYQGKALDIYMSGIDATTGLVVDNPNIIWSGYADVISFSLGSEVQISLTAEHRTSHLRRSNGLKMTTESHNARLGFPATKDLFFEPQDRLGNVPRPLLQS